MSDSGCVLSYPLRPSRLSLLKVDQLGVFIGIVEFDKVYRLTTNWRRAPWQLLFDCLHLHLLNFVLFALVLIKNKRAVASLALIITRMSCTTWSLSSVIDCLDVISNIKSKIFIFPNKRNTFRAQARTSL